MAFPELRRYPVVAIDVETTGLNWHTDKVFGIAVSTPDRDFYWDVRVNPRVVEWLAEEVKYIDKIVNQHIKFDIHMLRGAGIHLPVNRCECTMIRAALINEHLMRYDLDSLGKKYIGLGKTEDIYEELARLFGGAPTKNAQAKNMHRAPPELIAKYAKRDTRVAFDLWRWQEEEISRQDLHTVWALEKKLFPHIVEMERLGIRVSIEKAEQQQRTLDVEISRLQAELNKTAGFEVNPNPSGSIQKLFDPKKDDKGVWRAVDGTPLEATAAGKASINSDALERMKHPAAALIVRLRKYIKARDTFLGGHVIGHAHNGYVHPNINQTKGDDTGGTGTGRLSYTAPALQQIPSRDKEIARIVRPVFLPDQGQGWSYGDLDQHELRVFHHYVNNPGVVKAYADNPDLDGHQIVADLTGLPRNAPKSGGANAKQLNLAMVFNMGEGTIAETIGLPYTMERINIGGRDIDYLAPGPEAKAIIEQYHAMVPGVREMAKKAKSIARTRGYVKTLMGRHLRFPRGEFTHKASGLIYQGTSGDLNKLNIINICEYLEAEGAGARLLLSIHDEYSISTPYAGSKERMKEIQRLIQHRPELRIPIRIDFSDLADNWWESTCASHITK